MDRNRSSLLLAAAAYAAIGSACSLGALDGFAGGTEGDAGPTTSDSAVGPAIDDASGSAVDADAAAADVIDAGDAEAPSGLPNLVQNPGFENGSSCGPPWSDFQATISVDTERRSGAQSCKVCRWSGADNIFTINYSVTLDSTAAIGAKYHLSAYVRSKSGAPSGVQLMLRTWGPGGTTESSASSLVPLDGSWKLLEVTGTIGISPGAVDLYIASAGTSTADCFIVDDVRAERLQ